jgi:hypothetical protein
MSLPEDLSESPDDEAPAERVPMPPAVKMATAIAVIFIGGQVLGQFVNSETPPSLATLGSAGIGALIIAGFVNGHRLAWQWGRLIGLVLGTGFLLMSATLALRGDNNPLTFSIAAVFSASLILMGVLLGLPKSRAYFRLVCPDCGSREVKATDFLFNTAKCEKCECRW